ncbi:hypothetical protein KAR91_72940 [Candidatus Pacearchaeota archaeon]|nr:hypothetical protein [Candidatus Pacearchaeota archaeon]
MSEVIEFPDMKTMPEAVIEYKDRWKTECRHGKFIVDETRSAVECGRCGEDLNPIWALSELARNDSYIRNRIDMMNKVLVKAEKKNRCKCEKCGEMTRIQR